ncbi:helix-turn-helix transcriptional regulator [Cohnella lubricantis]|uniref:Helix-turn-helix transcriptional regulator n=2 Tax=Cohnella lubricantis TaxID=2163172 RepID=A0A841THD2_9BACL|nr:helix-turn-helix transcriptional regulator [Cohnella lubricantis]
MTYFVRKICNTSWKLEPHRISYYDLVFMLEGSADYRVDGVAYHVREGDLLLIKPGSERYATTTGMTCVAIDFKLREGEHIDLPVVSSRKDFDDFQWLFQELDFEWLQQKDGYQLKCQAIFALILHKLLFEGQHNSANVHVEAIKRYIVEHYDEKLSVAEVARAVKLNPVYCGALFKKSEGRSISEFINLVRVNQAASLLETGEYNVGEAAERTGFKDIYHFSNTFKRLMGMPPGTYRNKPAASRRLL